MTFQQFVYRNVVRNKRIYSAYFLSSSFSVMVFFLYALFIFHPDIKQGVTASVAVILMSAAEFIMYIFSFFFVLYSVSNFLKTRKSEFGLFMMHGMARKQLNLMVFLENMLIGTGAILTGIVFGMITGKLFLMTGSSLIGIDQLPFYVSWKPLALTACAFLLLFFCISLFTTVLVGRDKLIDLMKSGQKPKKEPRVSIILSLLSAVLLTASYYLAATTTVANVLIRVIPVIMMTIIGTYFLYTQLSVFLIKRLQSKRKLYWSRTNLLTISSLSYRLKDNARMFFMVTIISTVAFCAVGTLASLSVMNRQFQLDYPAAINYGAKDNQAIHEKNTEYIESELQSKNISYSHIQIPIKYVNIASSNDEYAPDSLPVISFSSYQSVAREAGFELNEEPLSGQEVLGMKSHRFELDPDVVTYKLKQNNIELIKEDLTEHVGVPSDLVEGDGLVVSDELFEKITADGNLEIIHGFFSNEIVKTANLADKLVEDGKAHHSENKPYAMTVSGTLLQIQKSMFKMMLFVALFVGAVFFIAAGSFLYFRLYADLDYDLRHYLTIKKVGLTDQELKTIITRQQALLFFVPIAVACIHSVFAFMALQSYFTLSIAKNMAFVLTGFFIAQLVYFLIIRHRYLKRLNHAFRKMQGSN